jgi:hypothetical protein
LAREAAEREAGGVAVEIGRCVDDAGDRDGAAIAARPFVRRLASSSGSSTAGNAVSASIRLLGVAPHRAGAKKSQKSPPASTEIRGFLFGMYSGCSCFDRIP